MFVDSTFFLQFRYLPELLEGLQGLAIGLIYFWGLAPILPQAIQVGGKVLPGRLIAILFIMICLALLNGPMHRWLVHWLRRKGWSDPHRANDD